MTNLAVHKNIKKNPKILQTISILRYFETFWCFTKFSFHHKRNDVRLLLKNMVYTSCLTSCRTTLVVNRKCNESLRHYWPNMIFFKFRQEFPNSNDSHREKLCFAPFNKIIHWNKNLATCESFHMLTQSIKLCLFQGDSSGRQKMNGCIFQQLLRQNLNSFLS